MWMDYDVRGQQGMDFFTGGSVIKALLWIMDLYFVKKWRFKVKNALMELFLTNMQLLASQHINWWTGVV